MAVVTVIYLKYRANLSPWLPCPVYQRSYRCKSSLVAAIHEWFSLQCSLMTRLQPHKILSKYMVVCGCYGSGSTPVIISYRLLFM